MPPLSLSFQFLIEVVVPEAPSHRTEFLANLGQLGCKFPAYTCLVKQSNVGFTLYVERAPLLYVSTYGSDSDFPNDFKTARQTVWQVAAHLVGAGVCTNIVDTIETRD